MLIKHDLPCEKSCAPSPMLQVPSPTLFSLSLLFIACLSVKCLRNLLLFAAIMLLSFRYKGKISRVHHESIASSDSKNVSLMFRGRLLATCIIITVFSLRIGSCLACVYRVWRAREKRKSCLRRSREQL